MYKEFRSIYLALWRQQGSASRIGLAISGGVDSMALAHLSSVSGRGTERAPSLTGFIVDHKLREGSTDEAYHVAKELERMDIKARVLSLDWTEYGEPAHLTNLESVARRLRYQALGVACREAGIQSLMVAHHADDQAETVLQRIVGGYMGVGLRGMRSITPIPECKAMYGVHASGKDQNDDSQPGVKTNCVNGNMLIEAGGVKIVRPLLNFKKAELTLLCKASGVPWFEDRTNTDKTFTLRNTTRYLLKDESLPQAFQSPRLLKLANDVSEKEDRYEAIAQKCFDETPISLNSCTATVTFTTPGSSNMPREQDAAYHVQAIVLRKLVSLACPLEQPSLQDLHQVTERVFDPTDAAIPSRVSAAGVSLNAKRGLQGELIYTIQRSVPKKDEIVKRQVRLPMQIYKAYGEKHTVSGWRLWDGRYWLRVFSRDNAQSSKRVVVRFLTSQDIADIRSSLTEELRMHFNEVLCSASGDVRYTIPAIFEQNTKSSDTSPADILVALPSLSWSHGTTWVQWTESACNEPGTCCWDIRYKSVDFKTSPEHTILGISPTHTEKKTLRKAV